MLTARQRERLGQRVASVMCVLLIISGTFYLRAARCLACDAYEKLWWSYLYADSTLAAERSMDWVRGCRPTKSEKYEFSRDRRLLAFPT